MIQLVNLKKKNMTRISILRWGRSEYDLFSCSNFSLFLQAALFRVLMFRSVENRYLDICLRKKSVPNLSWMMVSLPQGPDLPFPVRNLRGSQIFESSSILQPVHSHGKKKCLCKRKLCPA